MKIADVVGCFNQRQRQFKTQFIQQRKYFGKPFCFRFFRQLEPDAEYTLDLKIQRNTQIQTAVTGMNGIFCRCFRRNENTATGQRLPVHAVLFGHDIRIGRNIQSDRNIQCQINQLGKCDADAERQRDLKLTLDVNLVKLHRFDVQNRKNDTAQIIIAHGIFLGPVHLEFTGQFD